VRRDQFTRPYGDAPLAAHPQTDDSAALLEDFAGRNSLPVDPTLQAELAIDKRTDCIA
jgi:hypothetical protein